MIANQRYNEYVGRENDATVFAQHLHDTEQDLDNMRDHLGYLKRNEEEARMDFALYVVELLAEKGVKLTLAELHYITRPGTEL